MLDVNGTRYHLLLGESDWESCQSEGGLRQWEYDSDRQAVRLQAEVYTLTPPQTTPNPLPITARRGAARDTYGSWYWISADERQILTLGSAASQPEVLFPLQQVDNCAVADNIGAFLPVTTIPPDAPETLAGLTVTLDGYLVVGSPTTNSLLVFDLYALDGGFVRVPLPTAASPFDLAALPNGGLLILDRANKQVWRYNKAFLPRPHQPSQPGPLLTFQPQQGRERRQVLPSAVTAIALDDKQDPVAVAVLPDGSFWVLAHSEGMASVLWRYSLENVFAPQQLTLITANLVASEEDDLDLAQIRGYDIGYLPDTQQTGTLFIADISGKQAYALRVDLTHGLQLRIDRKYYPLRSFKGTDLVAVPSQGEVYYHQGQRWLPIKALPQMKYEQTATLLSPTSIFDGRDPGCVWHRLCLDACIPPDTQIQVETRAAEQSEDLSWQVWQLQPKLYLKPTGSEIPYSSYWSHEDRLKPYTGTWELLFQNVQGRYLQLRLTLMGNGRSTPTIRALRAYYPRFSYLKRYLPAVYQQDPVSAQFVEQFLANPEGIFTTIEGLIAQVQYLLDVRTVPAEAVDWLASWLGLALDPGWTDYQRRLLIAQAPYFFQRRGTLPGLTQAILLTVYPQLGPDIFRDDIDQFCPTIRLVERFLTRSQPSVAVGDPTEQESVTTEDDRAHRFTVMLPTTISESTQRLVKQIVELEKPAHTSFTIKQYWALFRVGEVRLGLDTVLGQGGRFEIFRLGQTALAEGLLGAEFPYNLTTRTVIAN